MAEGNSKKNGLPLEESKAKDQEEISSFINKMQSQNKLMKKLIHKLQSSQQQTDEQQTDQQEID